MQYNKEDVKAYECRHAVMVNSRDQDTEDQACIAKFAIHLKDGTIVPETRTIENYPRDFWVTKESCRDHKEKKTAEKMDRLKHITNVTDRLLTKRIAPALGERWTPRKSLKEWANSPYLYGVDDTTPVIIKRKIREKYPDAITPNSVCVMDVETDVVSPMGHPSRDTVIIAGATMGDKAVIAIRRDWLEGENEETFRKRLQEGIRTLLPEEALKRNIQCQVYIENTSAECIVSMMGEIHLWKPDIITGWNIDFDISTMIRDLESAGYDIADVFSDPCVPEVYRYAKYSPAREQNVTASDRKTSLHWTQKWNTFKVASGSMWLDAGCVYRVIRVAQGNQPSYSLNAILNHELGMHKLKFENLTGSQDGLQWHVDMQKNHKMEYSVYNLFDCIGIELLDEKTTDLRTKLPAMVNVSEYTKIPSQPKRIVDRLVPFYRELGYVMAGSARTPMTELDEYSVSREGWIVTLGCELIDIDGAKLFEDQPDHVTNIFIDVADLDVTGAYPNGQIVLNISRETERIQVVDIEGLSFEQRRSLGINLAATRTNALQCATLLYGLPTHREILDAFDQETVV